MDDIDAKAIIGDMILSATAILLMDFLFHKMVWGVFDFGAALIIQ